MDSWALVSAQDAVLRLLVATVLTGLIGLEREHHERPAGFRTNVLVGVGSCLFMMISVGLAGEDYDPARLAANVVVGIGFLGAGTIIRHGSAVRGLTTAAGLWVVSAIGVAAGMGWFEGAGLTTVLALLVLGLFRLAERRLRGQRQRLTLTTTVREGTAALDACLHAFDELGATVHGLQVERQPDEDRQTVTATLSLPSSTGLEVLTEKLAAISGVQAARWE